MTNKKYIKSCENFTRALVLSVFAPNNEKANECIKIAETIGSTLKAEDYKKYKLCAELSIEMVKIKEFLNG